MATIPQSREAPRCTQLPLCFLPKALSKPQHRKVQPEHSRRPAAQKKEILTSEMATKWGLTLKEGELRQHPKFSLDRSQRQRALRTHTTSPLFSEHKAIHTASAHKDNRCHKETADNTTSTQVIKTTQVSINFQSYSNYTLKNTKKCLGIKITNINFAKFSKTVKHTLVRQQLYGRKYHQEDLPSQLLKHQNHCCPF